MALTRDQKAAQLKDMSDKIAKAKSVMFTHYIGLPVSDIGKLRGKLREKNAEMKVGKKTLLGIALREANLPIPTEQELNGPVACIFSYEDPIAGAQIVKAFGKNHEQVALIGGVFDGKLLSKSEAQEFAMIPSRDVLLATFAGMIRSPLTSFASMIRSPLSGFARVLQQLAEKGGPQKSAAADIVPA